MKNKDSVFIFLIDNFIWLIVVVMIFFGGIFISNFFNLRNVINILYHSAALAVLVLGEIFVIATGNIDLSIEPSLGVSVAIPGLMAMVWFPHLDMPVWLFLIISLAIGLFIGLINGLFITKIKINSFLMTLSMHVLLYGILYFLVPKSLDHISKKYGIFGEFIFNIPSSIFLVLLLYVIFGVILSKAKFGRNLFAVGENIEAAIIAGIRADNIIILSYMICGFLASIAGLITLGRNMFISNNMGSGLLFMTIAAAVLGGVTLEGGTGSALGAFGGVILIGIIDNVLAMYNVSPYLVYAIKGFLIFISVWIDSFRIRIRRGFLIRRVIIN